MFHDSNQDYIFAGTNFDLGLKQLGLTSTGEGGTFDMRTLRYLLANCTYGGCMEDEMDRRTLSAFLEVVCPSGLLEDECSLDEVKYMYSMSLSLLVQKSQLFRWTGWYLQHEKLERLRNDDELPVEVADGRYQRTDANEQAS